MRFGEWMERRRIQVGLTKAALARAAGVSLSTIRTLECGGTVRRDQWIPPAPKDRTLARLAAALQVETAEVFALVGRAFPTDGVELPLDLRDKIDLLSVEERGAVEAIINRLLGERI